MKRRAFLLAGLAAGAGAAVYSFWPDQGLRNPCLQLPLPEPLARHELVNKAWEGLNPAKVWDVHVHLAGTGSSTRGVWVNPAMQSLAHPLDWLRRLMLLHATCLDADNKDAAYIERLLQLHGSFPAGVKFTLLAFDYVYNETGERLTEKSTFFVADEYAGKIAKLHPQRF